MTKVILVRHGQTDSNLSGRLMGQSDIGLNAEGRRQSVLVADVLGRDDVDALYTSDLRRAVETSLIIGEALGVKPIRLKEIREIDVGKAAGKTRDEVRSEYPELFGNSWMDMPFPEGESYSQVAARVSHALRTLLERHAGKTIALVTHGGAIRTGVASLTGLSWRHMFELTIANASITRLVADEESVVRLEIVSDVAHLEPNPGTKPS